MAECTWNMSYLGRGPKGQKAEVRIPIPGAYIYELTGGVDGEHDSDAERVVITVVSRITETI